MENKNVSYNAKTDHTIAGEILGTVRSALQEAKGSQHIELLKAGIAALKTRIDLRAEERKNALADAELEAYNRKYQTNFKRRILEMKDFDDTSE